MIYTPWPRTRIVAQNCGIIDPYNSQNALLFRGEEAFEDTFSGRARWSKPSPEPILDAGFESILLDCVAQNAELMNALVRELARKIAEKFADGKKPVLVAILRAGLPVCALLSCLLEEKWGAPVPIRAFSLFYGLGWDEIALEEIVAEFPERPLIFVDGWTSGGNVAIELNRAFEGWKAAGKPNFSRATKPLFAVLCDPRGVADLSAVQDDVWVPSSCFTAPETLGFSRGFARGEDELFGAYEFPHALLRPHWVAAWFQVLQSKIVPLPTGKPLVFEATPPKMRIHVNEVTRALINRDPREIWLNADENTARKTLGPMLHLAGLRGVPIRFASDVPQRYGASAVAQMA